MNSHKVIGLGIRRKAIVFLAFFVFCCLGTNATLHAFLHSQSSAHFWESADHDHDTDTHENGSHHHYDEEKLYLLSRPASFMDNGQILFQLFSVPWDSTTPKLSLPALVGGTARRYQSFPLPPSAFFSSHGNKAPPALSL